MMPAADYSLPVEEPLAQSASMARQWAALHCAAHGGGQSCRSYHGLWQHLRLMNLGPTLGGHADEYLQAMAELACAWQHEGDYASRRVLISGCADYSMLAHVRHAFCQGPSAPAITVLDICPTPLKLCAWYAQNVGLPIENIRSDLLEYQPTQGYDLIVTSSILGNFSPQARPRLFKAYYTMLRPGGRLIFSNRLRSTPESEQTSFTALQAQRFADKVAQSSHHLPDGSALSGQEARQMAMDYAGSRHPYPVNSADTIKGLATQAGLRWFEGHHVSSAAKQPGLSGPTLGDGSDYLFVILEK